MWKEPGDLVKVLVDCIKGPLTKGNDLDPKGLLLGSLKWYYRVAASISSRYEETVKFLELLVVVEDNILSRMAGQGRVTIVVLVL